METTPTRSPSPENPQPTTFRGVVHLTDGTEQRIETIEDLTRVLSSMGLAEGRCRLHVRLEVVDDGPTAVDVRDPDTHGTAADMRGQEPVGHELRYQEILAALDHLSPLVPPAIESQAMYLARARVAARAGYAQAVEEVRVISQAKRDLGAALAKLRPEPRKP